MTLLFDFDGTLVDVSRKYYATYVSFVRKHDGRVLPFEEYWPAKRAGIGESELLRRSGLERVAGADLRDHVRATIEEPAQLALDRPFEATVRTLSTLSGNHPCHLVSMRRNHDRLLEQVERLELRRFFASVIRPSSFPDDPGMPAGRAKADTLRGLDVARPALIVGDSGMDILAGQALGIRTCGVTTGVRDAQCLLAYRPDYVLDALEQLIPIVAELHRDAARGVLAATVRADHASCRP